MHLHANHNISQERTLHFKTGTQVTLSFLYENVHPNLNYSVPVLLYLLLLLAFIAIMLWC